MGIAASMMVVSRWDEKSQPSRRDVARVTVRTCAAILAVVAGVCAACKTGAGLNTDIREPAEHTLVAPVFEHGEGNLSGDCFECLDESEALSLIREVLARYGLVGFDQKKVFPQVTYETRHGYREDRADSRRSYGVFEEIRLDRWLLPTELDLRPFESESQFQKELAVDLYDSAGLIAIEFVSAFDASEIVALKYSRGKRRSPFQARAAANLLAMAAKGLTGPRYAAFFYDPMFSSHSKGGAPKAGSRTSPEKGGRDLDADLVRVEAERVDAQADSRRLLERQVIDFAEWLQSQRDGEPCRTRNGEARYMPYRADGSPGTTRAEGGYCGGEKNGVWTRWYSDGSLLDRGAYEAGVRVGKWEFHHPNGFLKEIGEYRTGEKIGPWAEFSPSGILLETANFDMGVPTGAYYHRTGTYYYRADERSDHVVTANFPNGEALIVSYDTWSFRIKKGAANGPAVGVSSEGLVAQGNLVRGLREGRWQVFGHWGCLGAAGDYVNGRREGLWTGEVFDAESNSCRKTEEVNYRNGVPHGYQRVHDRPPCPSEEGNWTNGKPDGVWVKWGIDYDPINRPENPYSCYEREKEEYWMGVRHGHWVSKYSNGCVRSEGDYKDDEKEGLWIEGTVRPNGECRTVKESSFRSGILNGLQTWHYEGTGRQLGILLDDAGLEPAKIETEYSDNKIVGVRKFHLRDGRYYRECEFDPAPVQPYQLRLRVIPEYVAPPGYTRWGDSNMSPPISARCRMWSMPEKRLIEDGEFVATSHEIMTSTGSLMTWYENGQPSLVRPSPDGPAIAYHSNGKVKSKGTYSKSRKDGLWERWYENGNLRERGEYRSGRRVGRWTFWFESGSVSMEGEFRPDYGGDRTGIWVYWDVTGDKRAVVDHTRGYPFVPPMECLDRAGERIECDRKWLSDLLQRGSRISRSSSEDD